MTQVAASSPSSIDFDLELTRGFAARYVDHKAWRLIGHTSLRRHDREDIRQDLLAAVWTAAFTFDPSVGDWESFVATVVERQAARLLARRRRRKRRKGNKTDSLDVLVKDADGFYVPLASQIGRDQQTRVTGNHTLDRHEQTELRLDLESLLAALPERERSLCLQLAELSQSELAQERAVARRTIRDILKRARRRLPEFGKTLGKFPKSHRPKARESESLTVERPSNAISKRGDR